MLTGAKKDAPAQPEAVTTHKGLIAHSRKSRAVKALLKWTNDLDRGVAKDIGEYAREQGLTKRKMLAVLREDEQLQKELFQPSMLEARMGLAKAVAVAYDQIGDVGVSPGEQKGWADFLAKLVNGYYEKKGTAGGNNVLINLVPQLAETQKHIAGRIIEVESLDELGA